MKHIKLTDILREIRVQQKKAIVATQAHVMNKLTLEVILNSNVLPTDQNLALKEFFTYYKYPTLPLLNENTIKRVDIRIVSEGFLDWIKQKGANVKDALVAGWNNVKKIWGNFKDFVSGVIEKIKETFKQIVETIKEKVNSAMKWITELPDKIRTAYTTFKQEETEKQKNLAAEIKDLSSCTSHIKSWIYNKLTDGTEWSEKILSGNFNSDDITENKLFTEKILLTLKEADGVVKPEDALKKFPVLHTIVKYTIKGLKWFFNPLKEGLKVLINLGTKDFFKAVSFASKMLDGPGTYEFPVLVYLLTEGSIQAGKKIEAIHDALETVTDTVVSAAIGAWSWLAGAAKPALDILETILYAIITVLGYYSTATLIINVIKPVYDKFIATNNPTVAV